MVGLTIPFSYQSLRNMIYCYTKMHSIKKENIDLTSILHQMKNSIKLNTDHQIVKNKILSNKIQMKTITFDKDSMFHDFVTSLLYYNQLCIVIKCILLHPLLKALEQMKQPKIGDIFSQTLKYLKKWIQKVFIFSFNGSRFDTILIHKFVTKIVLSQRHKNVWFQKYGNSLINLTYTFHLSSKINNKRDKTKTAWGFSSSSLCFKVF